MTRPLSRVWAVFGDAGYARNSRVQAGGGTRALRYSYGFIGFGVHRQLGHELRVYASYEFNDLTFDSSFCVVAGCNRTSQRHVGTIGLSWTPRPIRID